MDVAAGDRVADAEELVGALGVAHQLLGPVLQERLLIDLAAVAAGVLCGRLLSRHPLPVHDLHVGRPLQRRQPTGPCVSVPRPVGDEACPRSDGIVEQDREFVELARAAHDVDDRHSFHEPGAVPFGHAAACQPVPAMASSSRTA